LLISSESLASVKHTSSSRRAVKQLYRFPSYQNQNVHGKTAEQKVAVGHRFDEEQKQAYQPTV
jgi:hypothetical protein